MHYIFNSLAIFKVFLPALLFGPVLEIAANTRKQAALGEQSASSLQEITVPFFSSAIIIILTSLIADAVAWTLARKKQPIVRALIWSTITIGNNNLVLVISQPLCASFAPMMRDPKCFSNMTVYNALFSIPSTVFTVSNVHRKELRNSRRTLHEVTNSHFLIRFSLAYMIVQCSGLSLTLV